MKCLGEGEIRWCKQHTKRKNIFEYFGKINRQVYEQGAADLLNR